MQLKIAYITDHIYWLISHCSLARSGHINEQDEETCFDYQATHKSMRPRRSGEFARAWNRMCSHSFFCARQFDWVSQLRIEWFCIGNAIGSTRHKIVLNDEIRAENVIQECDWLWLRWYTHNVAGSLQSHERHLLSTSHINPCPIPVQ